MRSYWVYILSSRSRTLYTGVTGYLTRPVFEHKTYCMPGFAARYKIDRLVYFEETSEPYSAIAREKQIKSWRRDKKVALINLSNPSWEDLSAEWFELSNADSSLRSE
jgi:putative endonuclease